MVLLVPHLLLCCRYPIYCGVVGIPFIVVLSVPHLLWCCWYPIYCGVVGIPFIVVLLVSHSQTKWSHSRFHSYLILFLWPNRCYLTRCSKRSWTIWRTSFLWSIAWWTRSQSESAGTPLSLVLLSVSVLSSLFGGFLVNRIPSVVLSQLYHGDFLIIYLSDYDRYLYYRLNSL